ncbi:hypothetical protein FBU30_006014 [Linnemannia zychae]|nr:hypothetical protein FBU30_006014 [Linnemannia zychae]
MASIHSLINQETDDDDQQYQHRSQHQFSPQPQLPPLHIISPDQHSGSNSLPPSSASRSHLPPMRHFPAAQPVEPPHPEQPIRVPNHAQQQQHHHDRHPTYHVPHFHPYSHSSPSGQSPSLTSNSGSQQYQRHPYSNEPIQLSQHYAGPPPPSSHHGHPQYHDHPQQHAQAIYDSRYPYDHHRQGSSSAPLPQIQPQPQPQPQQGHIPDEPSSRRLSGPSTSSTLASSSSSHPQEQEETHPIVKAENPRQDHRSSTSGSVGIKPAPQVDHQR